MITHNISARSVYSAAVTDWRKCRENSKTLTNVLMSGTIIVVVLQIPYYMTFPTQEIDINDVMHDGAFQSISNYL